MPASWLEEQREAALKAFEAEDVPTWRRSGFWTTSLRGLDLDALEARHYEPLADGDALPPTVAEDIGDSELGGLIVQRGATTIRSWIDPEVAAQGVVVSSLEAAVESHPDEVRECYGKRLDPSEGKFTAASLAFWTGGAFVWVPKDVKVEKPIQIVYLIDEPGTAQYAQTLVVVGEHSQVSIREYDLGTPFEGQALHAGGFELFARPGSRAEVAHFQDWGPAEVYDISTKRVEVARDAFVSWVPIHLGGRLTKQTLDIITAEQGSDMRHTGMYFTEGEEHLDLFTTDRHEAGHTNGDTVWKGALTG